MVSDGTILRIVSNAISFAEKIGENWSEFVDERLTESGVELHDEQPDGKDHECIVRLADGREVYLETDGSNPGYMITNTYHEYTAEIDGGEGGSTIIRARNDFEARKLALEWVRAGEWKAEGSVNLLIYNRHCEIEETVQVAPTR